MFDGELIDQELNNTLIVIILKVFNLESISKFWPINLCSVLYKLIINIIVNQFKVVFPQNHYA